MRRTGQLTFSQRQRVMGVLLAIFLAGTPGSPAHGGKTDPIADVHVHYKWNQKEVTAPEEAIRILRDNHIELAVVIGTPAHYALELRALHPDVVIPVWSPYKTPADWSSWAFDKRVPKRAREALASGEYRGIGELHLIGGFAPDWRTPVISGLLQLGAEYGMPVILHTEISRAGYMAEVCSAFPETRILWAHAGAILPASAVAEVLGKCPNVWAELSARDPWRFVGNPITGADGTLLPAWCSLVEAYPERVVIGSDPVWPVEKLDSWAEPDSGWTQYRQFIDFHRNWIEALDPVVARKVRLENAQALFRPRQP